MFLLCFKVYFVLSYVAVFFIVKWFNKETDPFVTGCALIVSPLTLMGFAICGCVYCSQLICQNVGELFFGQPPTNKGEEDVN